MNNNIPVQRTSVHAKACADCHFAAITKSSSLITAYCIMFNLPIYNDEYYDSNSELRVFCRSKGDLFISALENISKTDLFEWRMMHENNVLSRRETHISTVAILIKLVLAVLALMVTYYQLNY